MVLSEESGPDNQRTTNMLLAIVVTFIITSGLGVALSGSLRGGTITRRPYNNRYNAAAGAREDAHPTR
jgi:Na+-driven multidrug efflux pump